MPRRRRYVLAQHSADTPLQAFTVRNVRGISFHSRSEKVSNIAVNQYNTSSLYTKAKSESNLNFSPEEAELKVLRTDTKSADEINVMDKPRTNELKCLAGDSKSSLKKLPSPHRRARYHDIFPHWKAETKCHFCEKRVGLNNHVAEAPDDVCRRCTLVGNVTSTTATCYNAILDPEQSLRSNLTLINLLAANALQLSIPACDAVLKKRRNDFIQLAGHPGGFAPAGPNTIWKRRMQNNFNEKQVYEELVTDVCYDVVPSYYREVEHNGEYFIEMEDLLYHFNNPNIMDIKMGTRTFLESEVQNPIKREDLYHKMVKLDPSEASELEARDQAVTKLRYMQFRERESSTSNLGFRIEAVKMNGKEVKKDFKRVKMSNQVEKVLRQFTDKSDTCQKLTSRLKYIRDKFQASEVFKHREIIGASILLLYDEEGNAGAWIIDFVKTLSVMDRVLDRRSEWRLGNHEDGFLFGLDNLIQIFESCCDR